MSTALPVIESAPADLSTDAIVPLGTPSAPLRCSKLAALSKCLMRVYLMSVFNNDDTEGGPAAQTGSLTHEGVAEFHRATGPLLKRRKAAFEAIKAHASRFPLAELNEVKLFLTPYTEDPRNIDAEFVLDPAGNPMIEVEVTFTLPPHPLDSTGEPIYVVGHVDQVRKIHNVAKVCDLKRASAPASKCCTITRFRLPGTRWGCERHSGKLFPCVGPPNPDRLSATTVTGRATL